MFSRLIVKHTKTAHNNMIKLTNAHTHKDLYVNPSHIVTFATHNQFNGGTATSITLDNSSKPVVDVVETPSQVLALIDGRSTKYTSVADCVIEDLNNSQVDGETMEYIVNEVGMGDQLLRQLVMHADSRLLRSLMQEKVDLVSKELNNNLMYKY